MTTWNDLKVEILVPAAATNYVTNPSFETNDTGYTLVGGGVTKSRVATEQRRGAWSLEITPVDSTESGVYFGTVSAVDGTEYTFSVDIKGVAGEVYHLRITEGTPTTRAESNYTGTGYWDRIELTFTAAATESWRLYVVRDDGESSTDTFYIDGLQFEAGPATTYFDGDSLGFVATRNDFGWNGPRHGSTSFRTAKTRAGGSLLNLEDYGKIINVLGLGIGQFTQSYTDVITGGALYEKHTRGTRPFSVIMQFSGDTHGGMAANRAAVVDAIRPDYAGDQPMVVRVTAQDTAGSPGGDPVDIVCMPLPSMTDTPQLPFSQRTVLQFRALDAVLPGAFHEGAQLDFADSLTNANYILMRDSDGVWQAMDTGMGQYVWVLIQGMDGYVYAGGNFYDASSVADTGKIAKWDGLSWSGLASGLGVAGVIYALAEDASGNIYVGGSILNMGGDADADYLSIWNGTSFSAISATVLNGIVYALAFDHDNDYLYIGGSFADVGGDADANKVVYWDGSSFNKLGSGGGFQATVWALAVDSSSNVYIGGQFINADSIAEADYIVKWDGTSFSALGDGLNGIVRTICVSSNGKIYVGGDFTSAGGNSNANYIACWNGAGWESLGAGLDSGVWNITELNDGGLLVGGAFTEAGGVSVPGGLAKWKDGSWDLFNIVIPNVSGAVVYDALVTNNNELIIGFDDSGTATTPGFKSISVESGSSLYPIVQIEGPGTIHKIQNFTSDSQITFASLTLLTGEVLTINFEPDNISAVSTFRGNCLNYIAPGSDLANFYLQPGTNSISLLMTGTDSDTEAVMYWKPSYWSLDQTKHGV